MSDRTICEKCRRPLVVCYCAHVQSIETRTRVLFLQHPRERDVPIGTVRIARLCLPNSELRLGVDFENDAVVQAAINDPARPAALLFPGPRAVDLRDARPEGPITLVMLDGTWRQAAKLLRMNPSLQALPQYRLTPVRPSSYRIRREPAEHCVATIEALAEVLGVLEGDPDGIARILAPFNAMVERQLEFASRVQGSRVRHLRTKRARRARPLPPVLETRADDVVVAYGEANAWPFDMVDAPAPQIVHWVAQRLSTGETFHAVIAPDGELAPTTPYHSGLPLERILGGESHERFAARWSAFLRPRDILATWGSYAPDVLEAGGIAPRERLDLRLATAVFLGARTGALEACPPAVGVVAGEPMCPGRAGVRFAALMAIAKRLNTLTTERMALSVRPATDAALGA